MMTLLSSFAASELFCSLFKQHEVVYLRLEHDSKTALVEFSTEEAALEVLKGRSLQINGATLELKSKKEFDTKRRTDNEEEVKKTKSHCCSDAKDFVVAFKLKWSAEGSKEESIEEAEVKKSGDDHDETDVLESEVMKDGINQQDDQTPRQDVCLEDLESVFQKFGTVKNVDFKIGSESGYIWFEDAGAFEKALQFAANADEGGIVVKNCVAILYPGVKNLQLGDDADTHPYHAQKRSIVSEASTNHSKARKL